MGVAALVLGIVSLLLGFIPLFGIFFIVLAIVGLILGIVDTVKKGKKKEPRGASIAGIVLSAIAIVVIVATTLFYGLMAYGAFQYKDKNRDRWNSYLNEVQEDMDDYLFDYYDNYYRDYNL